MKISELLEAPLPSDWDDAIYNPNVSFKKRVDYAKQMALKLGSGSSRIAFEIPYEGRKTVLKVAKNKKGVAQNKAEYDILTDGYYSKLEIFIPCIDADERGFTWIHTEYASKATVSGFVKECGLTPDQLVNYATNQNRHKYKSAARWEHTYDESNINYESPLINDMIELAHSDMIDIHDCSRIANWGIYQGQYVIIDAGFNDDTKKLYS